MALSSTPRFAVIVSCVMLSAHALPSWESWLQLPFFQHGTVSSAPASSEKYSGPEGLLLRQLDNLDSKSDPAQARTLHAAVARILRADGKHEEAIKHLEAARDAALRTGDADAILSTRLELAEAYIEQGRAGDADRELEAEPRTTTLLSPENFHEFSAKLDLASGRASFELGSTQLALEQFQFAADVASNPEDIVRSACEIAKAHGFLGHAEKSLEPLRKALHVVENIKKADTVPDALRRELALEVHVRFAEAYHALGDFGSAKKEYESASRLQHDGHEYESADAFAIKTGMKNLEAGRRPALRGPEGQRTQRFQLPKTSDAGKAFKKKISSLLEAHEYQKAEFELWHYLETQKQPYKSPEAATTLVSLGNLYLVPDHKSYHKATHCFVQAVQAALSCCGARSPQAKAAHKGLSFLQDVAPANLRSKVTKVMQEYADADEKFENFDLGHKTKVTLVPDNKAALHYKISEEASEIEKLRAQLAEREEHIRQLEKKASESTKGNVVVPQKQLPKGAQTVDV